jgi:CBS-domain-containing membrane protein
MSIASLFSSGLVTLMILIIMAAELFILRDHLRQLPMIAMGLGAGASLVMALGASLLGHTWHIIGLFLAISFVFHILEIQQCLRLAKRLPH